MMNKLRFVMLFAYIIGVIAYSACADVTVEKKRLGSLTRDMLVVTDVHGEGGGGSIDTNSVVSIVTNYDFIVISPREEAMYTNLVNAINALQLSHDIDIESVAVAIRNVSSNVLYYGTNNYHAARLANYRARNLEAWRNSVSNDLLLASAEAGSVTNGIKTSSYFSCANTQLVGTVRSLLGPYTNTVSFIPDVSSNRTAVTIGSRLDTCNVGTNSFVHGVDCVASGHSSHALGNLSFAVADYAVAEGKSTASGEYSHSEGYETTASGRFSHAEGAYCVGSNNFVYAWSGDSSDERNITPYGSHGDGTFNVNPVGGLAGLWIGGTNMYQHILKSFSWDEFKSAVSTEVISVAESKSFLSTNDVVDNVVTESSLYPLSANMGRFLNERIDAISSSGRYLSLWNCTNGLAYTNPSVSNYLYKTGDYFIVGNVSTNDAISNYMPAGTNYVIGAASTNVEDRIVSVNDTYYYDGTKWELLHVDVPAIDLLSVSRVWNSDKTKYTTQSGDMYTLAADTPGGYWTIYKYDDDSEIVRCYYYKRYAGADIWTNSLYRIAYNYESPATIKIAARASETSSFSEKKIVDGIPPEVNVLEGGDFGVITKEDTQFTFGHSKYALFTKQGDKSYKKYDSFMKSSEFSSFLGSDEFKRAVADAVSSLCKELSATTSSVSAVIKSIKGE